MRKQGTIKTYDPATKSGLIYDDEKNEYVYGPESYRETGMREFRLGQRVKFTLTDDAATPVRDLTIVSL